MDPLRPQGKKPKMEHVDHILIVDDDREIRELVSSYLTKNGLRTTVAADGRQMRKFLEANTADLIVLAAGRKTQGDANPDADGAIRRNGQDHRP
jgi:CheY-like chemotaxis protein